MSRYRNIHCLIWNDDRFPFTSDRCQLVFFHILTTPYSSPFGTYKASLEALAAEKRWTLKAYQEGFEEALANGFVKYNERVHVILIPNFLKYNPPNNPNVLRGWVKLFEELPNCSLKDECYQLIKAFAKAMQKGFDKAFEEAWTKPMPTQEQYQEQYQKQEQDLEQKEEGSGSLSTYADDAFIPSEIKPMSAKNSGNALTPESLIALYNMRLPDGIPRVERITDQRRKKAKGYLKQFPDHAFWEAVFAEVGRSSLLLGLKPSPGHEHFRADFDWLLSKGKDGTENCVKVYEGKYRDRQSLEPPVTHQFPLVKLVH